MNIRVGIDLVSVDSVREAVGAHGERYLRRLYTDGELSDCATGDGVDPSRLAARFAAKEATMKLLRREDEALSWKSISVRRSQGGWPDLHLDDGAAALARERGVGELTVSLTHEAGFAAAIVAGRVDEVNAG